MLDKIRAAVYGELNVEPSAVLVESVIKHYELMKSKEFALGARAKPYEQSKFLVSKTQDDEPISIRLEHITHVFPSEDFDNCTSIYIIGRERAFVLTEPYTTIMERLL